MSASILSAIKMGYYDYCKYTLKKAGKPNGITLQFMAAFIARFFHALNISSFYILRTGLMNKPHDQKIYNGIFDCFEK